MKKIVGLVGGLTLVAGSLSFAISTDTIQDKLSRIWGNEKVILINKETGEPMYSSPKIGKIATEIWSFRTKDICTQINKFSYKTTEVILKQNNKVLLICDKNSPFEVFILSPKGDIKSYLEKYKETKQRIL